MPRVSRREIREIIEEVEKFRISEESKALILRALAEELTEKKRKVVKSTVT